MTDTTLSLAARLAANLIVDAIKLAKPGARLAGKIGDRLLGGSPFDERRAMEFLTMGGANQLNEAEAQVDSLDPWWSDGGPTEFLGAHQHNTMPNWQAPQSSAPVAPKPTDVAGSAPGSASAPPLPGADPGHLNQPAGVGVVAPGTGGTHRIAQVLLDHNYFRPSKEFNTSAKCLCGQELTGLRSWREHVAPFIAAELQK